MNGTTDFTLATPGRSKAARDLQRISISQATRVFGLTARAIRFYEDEGLLCAHRDRLNVRWYDAEAREKLAWIAGLRSLGLGLPEVARVLECEAEPERRRMCRELVERRRAALKDQLVAVEEFLARSALLR
jgi:DNA-binding transcriptional MerR regulator